MFLSVNFFPTFLASHCAILNKHLLSYVLPSDPHSGNEFVTPLILSRNGLVVGELASFCLLFLAVNHSKAGNKLGLGVGLVLGLGIRSGIVLGIRLGLGLGLVLGLGVF